MPADAHYITVQALGNIVLTCRCGWYEDHPEDPPLWELIASARVHMERPCPYCGQTVEACGTSKRGCCPDCSNRAHPNDSGSLANPWKAAHDSLSHYVGMLVMNRPEPEVQAQFEHYIARHGEAVEVDRTTLATEVDA